MKFERVTKKRGNFTLSIPELTINEGYLTLILGENGSGKTTMLSLMTRILEVDSGEINFSNESIIEKQRSGKFRVCTNDTSI